MHTHTHTCTCTCTYSYTQVGAEETHNFRSAHMHTPPHTCTCTCTYTQVGAEETHYFRSADYARAMECNDADRRLVAATATLAVQKALQRQVSRGEG